MIYVSAFFVKSADLRQFQLCCYLTANDLYDFLNTQGSTWNNFALAAIVAMVRKIV